MKKTKRLHDWVKETIPGDGVDKLRRLAAP